MSQGFPPPPWERAESDVLSPGFPHGGGGGGFATPADYHHGSPARVWVWEPAITSPGFLTRDSHRVPRVFT
jgi:hypothetical protein